MSSLPEGPLGDQDPRICTLPDFDDHGSGERAVQLAVRAGLDLDPWQRFVLEAGLRRRGPRWAAFEVGLIVARQNGKGTCLEALELAALFLFPDVKLILHSAHEFKTAAEAFLRIRALIEDRPQFEKKIARVRTAAGAEAIELKNGKRLRFVARSSGSGRGFTSDLVILDEAYKLGAQEMAALLPTLSARPDPQLWYASTAGNQESFQLGRVRERGLKGAASLAFMEWSAAPGDDPADPAVWAKANPGMGIRIPAGYIEREMSALPAEEFARERLSIGDYPVDGDQWTVVPEPLWRSLEDSRSRALDPLAFAVEVGPERRTAAIGACGLRRDGRLHVELIDHHPGTDWVQARISELARKWRPCGIVLDPGSHAGALIEPVQQAGVEVVSPFTARDAAAAHAQFLDAVRQDDLRHLGQPELTAALARAKIRPLGDAQSWDRKNAEADYTPLTAVTLALWAINRFARSRTPHYDLMRSVG